MEDVKKKKILEVAKYVIENRTTNEETAEHFGISISTVKKYINNRENLQSIDIDIYNLVKDIQKDIQKIRNIVGGMNGKREPSYTDFEILEIVETIIGKDLTLKQASYMFQIPTSTLYDRIKQLNYPDLREQMLEIFKIHKMEYFQSVYGEETKSSEVYA